MRAVLCTLALIIALALLPSAVQAHWCHDLWGSSYNIVVRPETDEVVVPSSGDTDLVIYVQNNMGYPLVNFDLDASASGYSISVSRAAPKVSNYLMPGEKLRHTLTISRSGGATLQASEISFSVAFGNSVQDDWYPWNSGEAVMMKLGSGALAPSSPPSLGEAHGQALQLGHSTVADYGTTSTGLDDLLQLYCAGRGSWGTGGGIITSHCSSTSATSCPSRVTRSHTKYDYQHLWGAEFLAARKSGMSAARRDTFRERLMCGYDDSLFTFRAFAAMMLGYMGPEGGSDNVGARAFLLDEVSNGSADEQAVAKAALLLYGNSSDVSAYHGDVTSGLSDGNAFVECASAAALGIVDGNDAAVESVLIAEARWTQPDTGNNGLDFYCAHLLDLVAWHRRAWAPDADDTGVVSFFEGEADTVAPAAPGGVSCTPQSGGRARIDWNQVTLDTAGDPENVTGYRVYYGTTARPGGATRPGEQGFDYDHVDPTSGIYLNASGLTEGETYHFTVTAVDASSNHSVYSTEVNCDIPLTNDPPVADLSCTPTSGDAPLHVVCDGTGSTDPDGAGDLAHYYFNLDGAGETEEADGIIEYDFASAGSHSVVLRVEDAAGEDDTDSAAISVTVVVNQAPTAAAGATPESGYAPLEVVFSSSGSSDPDGDPLTYSWDFDDSSAASTSANPTHTFTDPGQYLVTLTVSDDGSPPLTGADVVEVNVDAPLFPPVADLACTPASGEAPLDVTCSGLGSTDPNGAGDIAHYFFRLDGQAEVDEASGEASYHFADPGSHSVVLRVEDAAGLDDTSSAFGIEVTAPAGTNQPPVVLATGTPLSGTAPLDVTFDASGSSDPDGDNLTFSWSFDDGSGPDTSAVTAHTFSAPGTYTVTVTVTDDGSPPRSAVATLNVEALDPAAAPTAVLTCTPTSGAAPLTVDCDGLQSTDPNGATDIATYSFSLDGQAAVVEADAQLSYTFDQSGNHTVLLRVIDQGGLEDTDSAAIQVSGSGNQPPSASASASPESGFAPLTVDFSAAGSTDPDGDPITFSWSFGDGSALDTAASPTHTYTTAGTYTATLTVSDDASPPLTGVASVVISVTESSNAPPIVSSASATPRFGPAPLSVHFDATGVYDPDSDNVALTWSFGDGTPTAASAAVDHTYNDYGVYTATLSAQDDGTPTLQPATASFTISVTDNQPPDASAARVTPLAGAAPLAVTMDASACLDPDGDNVSATWTVELSMDESVSYASVTAQHAFTEVGDYDVTVILRDDGDPPLEVTRGFVVMVQADDGPAEDTGAPARVEISEGCACSSGPARARSILLLLGFVLGALLRRRAR